jgi:site-specific recombinase XerD
MEAGGELLALKEIMGHRDVTTTERYAAPADAVVRRDASTVHAQLAGGGQR